MHGLQLVHRISGVQYHWLQKCSPKVAQQAPLQQALPVAQALHEPQCSAVLVATQVPSQQVSPEPQALHEPQC